MLARELSVEEIKEIKDYIGDVELEAFVQSCLRDIFHYEKRTLLHAQMPQVQHPQCNL